MLARYNDPDQLEQAQQRFALRPGAINQAVAAAPVAPVAAAPAAPVAPVSSAQFNAAKYIIAGLNNAQLQEATNNGWGYNPSLDTSDAGIVKYARENMPAVNDTVAQFTAGGNPDVDLNRHPEASKWGPLEGFGTAVKEALPGTLAVLGAGLAGGALAGEIGAAGGGALAPTAEGMAAFSAAPEVAAAGTGAVTSAASQLATDAAIKSATKSALTSVVKQLVLTGMIDPKQILVSIASGQLGGQISSAVGAELKDIVPPEALKLATSTATNAIMQGVTTGNVDMTKLITGLVTSAAAGTDAGKALDAAASDALKTVSSAVTDAVTTTTDGTADTTTPADVAATPTGAVTEAAATTTPADVAATPTGAVTEAAATTTPVDTRDDVDEVAATPTGAVTEAAATTDGTATTPTGAVTEAAATTTPVDVDEVATPPAATTTPVDTSNDAAATPASDDAATTTDDPPVERVTVTGSRDMGDDSSDDSTSLPSNDAPIERFYDNFGDEYATREAADAADAQAATDETQGQADLAAENAAEALRSGGDLKAILGSIPAAIKNAVLKKLGVTLNTDGTIKNIDPDALGKVVAGGAAAAALIADRNKVDTITTTRKETPTYAPGTATAIEDTAKAIGANKYTPTLGSTAAQTTALANLATGAGQKYGGTLGVGLDPNETSGISAAKNLLANKPWQAGIDNATSALGASGTALGASQKFSGPDYALDPNQQQGITAASAMLRDKPWQAGIDNATGALGRAGAAVGASQKFSGPDYALDPNQVAAGQLARDAQGNWVPAANLAGSAISRAADVGGAYRPGSTDISSRMNPYAANVTKVLSDEARRQSEITGQYLESEEVKANRFSFGGSRGALLQAERYRNLGTQQGNIAATQAEKAYTEAVRSLEADQARGLEAGKAAGELATRTGALSAADIENLSRTGAASAAAQDKRYQWYLDEQKRLRDVATDEGSLATGYQNAATTANNLATGNVNLAMSTGAVGAATQDKQYQRYLDEQRRLQDISSGQQALATGYGNTATTANNLATSNINTAMATGAIGQANAQNAADKDRGEWLRQLNAQLGFDTTALDLANTNKTQDIAENRYATTIPGINAASLKALPTLGTSTTNTVTGPRASLGANIVGAAGALLYGTAPKTT